MKNTQYSFATSRLLVGEWHSFDSTRWDAEDLAVVVTKILNEAVTRALPPAWRGSYDIRRAREWIQARDEEGATLLVVDQSTRAPVGLVILFEDDDSSLGTTLRLGYMLAQSAWGRGLGTELVLGFLQWCQKNNVSRVFAGVERDNVGSVKVLERSGFVLESSIEDSSELMYQWHSPKNLSTAPQKKGQ